MHLNRRAFGRRSRASVVWGLALFAAGQLVVGLVLDYRYPRTRFPSAAIMLDAAAQEPQPAVAFFGSSRMGAAIDITETNKLLAAAHPRDAAPRAVMLAVPAGDAISAEFILGEMLKRGQKPRWAVIEVGPETVNSHNMWMVAHVMRQLNWEHVVSHFWAARRGRALWYYLEARTVPVYTHRKQLVKDVKSSVRDGLPSPAVGAAPAAPLDWKEVMRSPERLPDDELLALSQTRAAQVTRRWLRDYQVGGVTAEALERVLARCREEKIGVVLLGIPACTAHRAEFNPEMDTQYLGYMNRLTREYGCRFVDCRDWIADTLFLDDMHLRFEDGARVFTDRFAREVLVNLPMD